MTGSFEILPLCGGGFRLGGRGAPLRAGANGQSWRLVIIDKGPCHLPVPAGVRRARNPTSCGPDRRPLRLDGEALAAILRTDEEEVS